MPFSFSVFCLPENFMKRRIEQTVIYYKDEKIISVYDCERIYKKSKWSMFYDVIGSVMSAIVAIFLVFAFLFRAVSVSGRSMVPTLNDRDWLIISRTGYTASDGDIVVVSPTQDFDEPIIKRVIGVAGDTIDIDFEKGVVYRNGEQLSEEYTNTPTNRSYDIKFPLTVPEGCVFVMGDNRNNSLDSRSSKIGLVDCRNILGRVIVRILPFGDFKVS